MIVITDLEVGGVPLHLHRLTLALRERGYRPSVVSLAPPGPVTKMLQDDGIPVDSCQACCGWDLRVIPRLARLMGTERPDVVHAILFHANLAARFAAPRADISDSRVLCEIQTVEVDQRWHLTVDRWTQSRCRLTIGNSPSVIEHLATHGGIDRRRLRLVRRILCRDQCTRSCAPDSPAEPRHWPRQLCAQHLL
ncbi:MAG: glycosyltransferase [Planctomycetes bacterium]|nr:glycosyltransferase [Planctomycetota bacterium]